MVKSKIARATRAQKKRAEKPVSAEIRRAAERAGIDASPFADGADAGLARGDVAFVTAQIAEAFDAILDAESLHDGGERDAQVLGALKRLRVAQHMLSTGAATGGVL